MIIITVMSILIIAIFVFLLTRDNRNHTNCHPDKNRDLRVNNVCPDRDPDPVSQYGTSFHRDDSENLWIFASLSLATAGALSNLIDRVVYGHTVDYILIFTGIINLADVLIVVGIVGYVYYSRKTF